MATYDISENLFLFTDEKGDGYMVWPDRSGLWANLMDLVDTRVATELCLPVGRLWQKQYYVLNAMSDKRTEVRVLVVDEALLRRGWLYTTLYRRSRIARRWLGQQTVTYRYVQEDNGRWSQIM